MTRSRRLFSLATLLAALAASAITARAQGPSQPAAVLDAVIHDAYRAAYNLDHDQALTAARRAVQLGPDESRSHRTLASILWLHILFRRGAVSVDYYMGNLRGSTVNLPKPPPDLDAEFKRELARAIDIAEARVKAGPHDMQARYDAGAAYGLQASYTASVEGRIGTAFQAARRAYNAQEAVLSSDPLRVEAGLIVGTYRYLVSTMALPTRLLAYVVGFGGGREKGIGLLEAAAARPTDVGVDAKTALMLIYSREGRHDNVVAIARELGARFPRNRLFILEEGSAAIRAGRAAEAEAALTRGLAAFEQDTRPKVPGERALWLFKRGLARIDLNRLAEANVDLHEAMASGPVSWVTGRIHIGFGKIADLGGRRQDAVAAYRTGKAVCERENDPLGSTEASRLIRRPFTFPVRRGQ